jgi:hypothetical protein
MLFGRLIDAANSLHSMQIVVIVDPIIALGTVILELYKGKLLLAV